MPYRDLKLRVEDILEAISKIERYTANMSFEDFLADDKSSDAVVRNLEIIGEAARNIPEDICLRFPSVPWDKMRGMRNMLAHEYFGVSLQIIWQTVKDDLPPLVTPLQEILNSNQP